MIDKVRYNMISLQDDSIKFLYLLQLPNKSYNLQDGLVKNMYISTKKGTHEASKKALGEKLGEKTKGYETFLWNEDRAHVIQRKKQYMVAN